MSNVSDNFNRADEIPISGNWTVHPQVGTTMNLVGNQVVPDASGSGFQTVSYQNVFNPTPNQFVQILVPTLNEGTSTSSAQAGVALRLISPTQTYYTMQIGRDNAGGSGPQMQRRVNGVKTTLTSSLFSAVAPFTMSGEVIESHLVIRKDGLDILNYDDVGGISSGSFFGLYGYFEGDGLWAIDNFFGSDAQQIWGSDLLNFVRWEN